MQLTNRQLFQQHLAIPADVPDALEIEYAEGIYLIDDKGDRYTDLVSGVSVSNIGHRHPAVIEAVSAQMEQYMHLMVYGKYIQSPQVKLAGALTALLPEPLKSVYLVNSGSEAIEGALKLAKRVTGRTELISFKNAYHGSTHGALSVLGNEEMKTAFRPLLPDTRLANYNDPAAIELITERTAAILMEPVQAEAGIIIPDSEWVVALRKRCTETGTMLIFDEVQMGFGRSGRFMTFEHFGIVPDILCLAKGMGGGMPIGAFVASPELMNKLTYNPSLGHITTFGGHPVSAAAALATIKVINDEKLCENARLRGTQFVENLKDHPAVKEIRQIGLMLGVEINGSASQLVKILQKNKLIVDQFLFDEHSFRIAPPLTISAEQVNEICKNVVHSLDELIES